MTAMNIDTALLDVRPMEEVDRLTVAAGTPAVELMERAGSAVAQQIQQRWSARPLLVLCGPGNNGGDGFVTARKLAEAGWPVRIARLDSRDPQKGEASHNARRWDGAIESLTPVSLDRAELVVDAIFGAGLSRALAGQAADTLAAAAAKRLPIIAIDVPSGLMGATGEVLGAVAAVLTVTFFRKKPGHLLLPGKPLCGEVVVSDIGIPSGVLKQVVPSIFENDPRLWLSDLPLTRVDGNKYSRGHALISGGYPVTGAGPNGRARGGSRRCRTHDDCGSCGCPANLRGGLDQHHGSPACGAG